VSTIGWLGFLAGPAAIGFAAGAVGLRAALAIVVGMTLLLAILGQAIQSDRRPVGQPAPRPVLGGTARG
jgi:predicted lipid-binding transport protein (Tim44 family)